MRRIKWQHPCPVTITLSKRYRCYIKLVDELNALADARHEDVTFMVANILKKHLKTAKKPNPYEDDEDERLYFVPVEMIV